MSAKNLQNIKSGYYNQYILFKLFETMLVKFFSYHIHRNFFLINNF